MEYGRLAKVRGEDIALKKYLSIFEGEHEITKSFESILAFF